MIKAGIIGATGYAGGELVRILLAHKDVEIKWYGSRSYIDKKYSSVYQNMFQLVEDVCRDDNLEALADQVVMPNFWMIVGASFGRIALGFLLSFVVGFLLALVACRVRLFRDFIDPIISLLRTIPVASFIILLLIWVGNQALTVFLAFFIVLPLIYTNMVTGFESVDKQMLEMARVYGLSRWRTFLYVYRPAFMPFLLSSTKISLGMTWKSGIMAEVLATPKPSIGKEMATARTFLDTPDLLAWTVVVMVASVLFEKAFMALLKRANRPLGGLIGKRGE